MSKSAEKAAKDRQELEGEYIDCTPTWAGLLPAFLAVLTHGTEVGKREARTELMRMATAADRWNANAKRLQDAHELLKRILGMHECGNNGAFNGEAMLNQSVVDDIRRLLLAAGVKPYNFRAPKDR
jgi:hypothetical protein